MSELPLYAEGVAKSYAQGETTIEVLKQVDLRVDTGERVALVGRSGSGKSTLLHLLAGLEDADAGTVRVAGADMGRADMGQRARIRNEHMGFVYQLHHLLPEFSALENVAMPLRLRGVGKAQAQVLAHEMLDAVALGHRTDHRPQALSGGERQRVAVARALVGDPQIVLADEPTGSLDEDSARSVFDLICRLSDERGVSFLIATHDRGVREAMDRVLVLESGSLHAEAR